eukprot:scaffold241420_cov17-Tisochrysis_lutea.AAC.1
MGKKRRRRHEEHRSLHWAAAATTKKGGHIDARAPSPLLAETRSCRRVESREEAPAADGHDRVGGRRSR